MANHFLKNQEGAVAVVMGIMIVAIMGFVGLALDLGYLMVTKTKMQNAVDAAAAAGALQFSSITVPPSASDQTKANSEANTILQSNGFTLVTVSPTYPTNATWNGNSVPAISVSFTQTVPNLFMTVLGISSVQLSAAAEAVLISLPSPGKPFFNSLGVPNTLFSVQNLTLNGSQSITGTIFTDAYLTMNGSEVVNGNAVGVQGITMCGSEKISGYAQATSVGEITLNGSEQIGGGTKGGATNISLPDFSQAIINATSSANTYSSSQTFNGITNVNGSIYVNGDVTINGSVNWNGCILATGNITINGSSQITGSNQVFLYSGNGNITDNGSSSFGTGGTNGSNVIAYAPNGTIIINGSSSWYGLVIGNQLTLNGSGNFNGSGVTNLNSIPTGAISLGPAHSKLIN
jgi:Flp pilus assembly protein TadG